MAATPDRSGDPAISLVAAEHFQASADK